ncbi:hypothetical protein BOTBODRAFT_31926 [Botryobasidium botryosum FD-172 SS1]|uniref:Phosphoribulokinase/uridine kinase domain-containing protein n=1 Tax=Botryobasidium botryosum (strain FD-172 SS1) TaxID=930990 RepID=A0A067MHM3_BOTB1|nr:hypothetical protein BOTBODRAFT_31926 [Botryobasidium botryosum FD-172 SS1]
MSVPCDDPHIQVILIGIGGPTCSGKSTLAKQIIKCFQSGLLIHQDNFAQPIDNLPIHPVYSVLDADDAPTAIDWPRFITVLNHVKRTGRLPTDHAIYEDLNPSTEVLPSNDKIKEWQKAFAKAEADVMSRMGQKVVWVILEGFLLFWDQAVVDAIDVPILLRLPQDLLQCRRRQRQQVYILPDGTIWEDPPHYWEQIQYPAYKRAHQHLYVDGDVENGRLSGEIDGLLLLDVKGMSMDYMLDASCQSVMDALGHAFPS